MAKLKKKKRATPNPAAALVRKIKKGTLLFDLLEHSDQVSVFEYIKEKHLDCKIFEKRGFDILSTQFFAYECFLDEDYLEIKTKRTNFDSFGKYFENINGDIYRNACYYGYKFSEEEINKFNLKTEELNFDSFIKEDITGIQVKKEYSIYAVKKYYENGKFIVHQEWFKKYKYRKSSWEPLEEKVFDDKREFDFFADFVHYLKGDLSNADFIMCDNMANIEKLVGLKLDGVKVRSEAAKAIGLPLSLVHASHSKMIEFEESASNELATIGEYGLEHPHNEEYTNKVSYITDIHMLHRYDVWKCKTVEDRQFVTQLIANKIAEDDPDVGIKLIGGDVSSDFGVYRSFLSTLKESFIKHNSFIPVIFTLGNHELWPFAGNRLDRIVEKYHDLLSEKGMYLLHNNLYYRGGEHRQLLEIEANELEEISEEALREKLRSAGLVVFGGMGFAGENQEFNADQGIYRGVVSRAQEIEESKKFDRLYTKVSRALYDKNVVVFTHMPISDWSKNNEQTKRFVYVSGHNHKNYFFDDGDTRIYADNQIGYKQKSIHMKHFPINIDYDWFRDYPDGIHKINREDYKRFYYGINEYVGFNREHTRLYMLKREGLYMFLMKSPNGKLYMLSGGIIKSVGEHTVEYFFKHMVSYSQSIKMYLSKYEEYQNRISHEIKELGGCGKIHGCIVDVDPPSRRNFSTYHLYINPLDRSITPYWAPLSMVEKFVYKNIPSMLKCGCPQLYSAYNKKYTDDKPTTALVSAGSDLTVSSKTTFVRSTGMYKISRIIKGLQYTTRHNVIRLWNDLIAETPSEENGRLIVSQIIDLKVADESKEEEISMKKILASWKREERRRERRRETDPTWQKKEAEYKTEVAKITQTIEVLKYRGTVRSSEYQCKLCGHNWKQYYQEFDRNPICPNCKK